MHEGHRDRVRQRFISDGLDNFEPHQVLELLLFYVIPRQDTNVLAHKILDTYGSLSALFEADHADIVKRCKLSENTATLLKLIPSVARYYFQDRWGDKPLLDSSKKAGEYTTSLFVGRHYEVFYVICLDSQNQVLHSALVHEGTVNESPIYPRLIVETALRHTANSVILAHNHPGGSLTPSRSDIDATSKIKSALESISIKVLDHIIVAGDQYTSFAEKGLLG